MIGPWLQARSPITRLEHTLTDTLRLPLCWLDGLRQADRPPPPGAGV